MIEWSGGLNPSAGRAEGSRRDRAEDRNVSNRFSRRKGENRFNWGKVTYQWQADHP